MPTFGTKTVNFNLFQSTYFIMSCCKLPMEVFHNSESLLIIISVKFGKTGSMKLFNPPEVIGFQVHNATIKDIIA